MAGEPPPHIVVDLGEVRDVMTWLHRESEFLAEERRSLQPLVHFGQYTPCGEVNAARRALLSALDQFQTNTDRHRHHILALSGALEQIHAQYATADRVGTSNMKKLDR